MTGRQLFRGMIEAADGLPKAGVGGRLLGLRPLIDVAAAADSESVSPASGGLSVSPDSPNGLPRHRRPSEFGGTGKDPVWVVDEDDLPPELTYRPDPSNAYHGFIEPVSVMTLQELNSRLAATRHLWRRVNPGDVNVSSDSDP